MHVFGHNFAFLQGEDKLYFLNIIHMISLTIYNITSHVTFLLIQLYLNPEIIFIPCPLFLPFHIFSNTIGSYFWSASFISCVSLFNFPKHCLLSIGRGDSRRVLCIILRQTAINTVLALLVCTYCIVYSTVNLKLASLQCSA